MTGVRNGLSGCGGLPLTSHTSPELGHSVWKYSTAGMIVATMRGTSGKPCSA